MSKINQLIKNLCPAGVKYKKLEDVLTIKNGRDYKQYGDGDIPVYGSGGIITYIDTAVYDKPSVLIPRKGSLDKLYYVDTPFWNVDTIFYTDIDIAQVEPKYVYYYLEGQHLERLNKAGGVPSLTQAVLNKTELPVPPLEVQREIVRVLDSFTFLSAELSAELQARKKQYEFYRNSLLLFNDAFKTVPLKDVVKNSCSGSTPQKSNTDYYENGTIPWIRTQDVCFNEITNVESFITEKALEETSVKMIPENCVIVAISGATAGRCAVNKIRATTNQHCLNLEIDKNKALYKYVYYCLCSKQNDLISRKQGARGDLNSSLVLSLEIPIPNLDIQEKIVNVLDNFESICNDLNIGLPAEIEARQKQYEYYRDMLLTFAETGDIMPQTDRQTDRQTGRQADRQAIIKLLQYVFGYAKIELGEIGKVSMCKRILKAETSDVCDVPFYKIGTFGKEADAYIDREKFEEYKKLYSYPKKGEILISAAGTIGRTVIYDGEDAYYQDSNIVWIENDESIVLNKYLFYCYQLQPWTVANGGTIARLYNDILRSTKITVLSLSEQERIVSILDKFDALCNDLSSGLPAEIEMRQKQYEYYRDKLLSFKAL